MTSNTTNYDSSEKEKRLLSSDEQTVLSEIATKDPPYSQRAAALLAINNGATQAEAGNQAGLTFGQVRYWLIKFRGSRMSIFPNELLIQEQSEQPEDEEDVQVESLDAEATTGLADSVPLGLEDTPKVKKKKSKKAKKSSKAKKPKKEKKASKGKKPKKKSEKDKKAAKRKKPKKKTKEDKSRKTKGKKGKSSKQNRN